MARQSANLKRRGFLAAVAASSLGCSRTKATWWFFTAGEARLVDALTERIIPADQDPGASQAGVVEFIDRQLVRHYRKYQTTYRGGLAAVEASARARFGKAFADLPPDAQSQLLAAVEEDPATKDFFAMLVAHTMQGYYGDPRHGGNRDQVAWRMLGLPYPPVRGRDQYDFTAPKRG